MTSRTGTVTYSMFPDEPIYMTFDMPLRKKLAR